jgi:hypothetical protein
VVVNTTSFAPSRGFASSSAFSRFFFPT